MVPGLDGYSVTNRYEIDGGLSLFYNYTNMMNTKIEAESDTVFKLSGFPLLGAHYVLDESYVKLFLDALNTKRAYINDCLTKVENNFDIDLKFFNSYGPSQTFSIGDAQNTMLDRVDISMNFRAKLASTSDIYTKDALIAYVKDYVEDISDTGSLHIPNLITELENQYGSAAVYIEFMYFNNFWLGVQHIELLESTDPHVVPEFISIRNRYNEATDSLEPCIDVECIV
jgi:hypothetical protein